MTTPGLKVHLVVTHGQALRDLTGLTRDDLDELHDSLHADSEGGGGGSSTDDTAGGYGLNAQGYGLPDGVSASQQLAPIPYDALPAPIVPSVDTFSDLSDVHATSVRPGSIQPRPAPR